MARDKGLNPFVQFTDSSQISKRCKAPLQISHGQSAVQNTELCTVTFHVSYQKVWGGKGRQGTSLGQAAPVLLFSKKTEKKEEKRKKSKKPAC